MLPEDARNRYIERHGSRYYVDTEQRTHGGLSPKEQGTKYTPAELVEKYYHRGDHDVESIFWSMVCVLLRAKPVTYQAGKYATGFYSEVWKELLSHEIPEQSGNGDFEPHRDERTGILDQSEADWIKLFPPEMKDVAILLYEMSQHVRSEYGLWSWKEGEYDEAHLHEALQRLIFAYLWKNKSNPIPLDPSNLRSITPLTPLMKAQLQAENYNRRHQKQAPVSSAQDVLTKVSSPGATTATCSRPQPTVIGIGQKRGIIHQGVRGSKYRRTDDGSPVTRSDVHDA